MHPDDRNPFSLSKGLNLSLVKHLNPDANLQEIQRIGQTALWVYN